VPGAVLVVQRWNHWVRIYDPATDELTWVDLAEHEFQRVPPEESGRRSSTGA
jgi:hypothetical protein